MPCVRAQCVPSARMPLASRATCRVRLGHGPSTVLFSGSRYCSLVAAVQPDLAALGLSPWPERASGQGPQHQHLGWHRTQQGLRQLPDACPLPSVQRGRLSPTRASPKVLASVSRVSVSHLLSCRRLPFLSSDLRISVFGARPARPSPFWVFYLRVRGSGEQLHPLDQPPCQAAVPAVHTSPAVRSRGGSPKSHVAVHVLICICPLFNCLVCICTDARCKTRS